ncbi:mannosyltransferase family protein [Anaerolineales bacterium HSG25]|nr:mannosyltransferase family protein [Anaerolineales bacterium HSG25]
MKSTESSRLNLSKAIGFDNLNQNIKNIKWHEYDWLTTPFLAFFISRLLIFAIAYLAEITIPSQGAWHARPDNLFLDIWARFDSGFYLSIITEGYAFNPGEQSNIAFFPLYPLLSKLVDLLINEAVLAGIIVSNLCYLVGLIFLYRLTELEFQDRATANRTVFYISIFPTSFFFSTIYTESTFFACSVATLYFARRRLWGWATLFGLLTTASRIVGILMWGVVMLEWMTANGWTISTMHRAETWRNLWRGLRHDWRTAMLINLIPLGIISYMLFLQQQFQDPVAFWTVQAAWGRTENVGPLVVVWRDVSGFVQQNFKTGEIWWQVPINVPAFLFSLGMSVLIWRRLGESYALYIILSVMIPAASAIQSMIRYLVVLFPLFMMLGYWGRNRLVDQIILISFASFLSLFIALFVNWIFIA